MMSPRVPPRKTRNGITVSSIISHFLVGVCGVYIGISMSSFTCATTNKLADTTVMRAEVVPEPKAFSDTTRTFPKTVDKMIVDYATVPRDQFINQLEIGTPMDETKPGSEDVLVLYTDVNALPYKAGGNTRKKERDNGPKLSIDSEQALENCNIVKVILQKPADKGPQCFAIVPQWESYHVHKFMRMPKEHPLGKHLDPKLPLRYTSRSMSDGGKENGFPTWDRHTKGDFDALVEYINHLETAKNNLKPQVEKSVKEHASAKDTSDVMKESKVMVVMVCNKGQSHLFHNFVCNARAKGLDLSRIIMFATDKYTADLSESLGIPVFFDEKIFGNMPEQAAGRYGDKIFSKMMMAKVYCVHLVMQLGYDVLFQDVDVVWRKNPLEHLESVESKEWDMIFQDDGSRQVRYQPYSPNTGFYFVRNNDLTQYFFNSLLKKGDLIAATKSHQAALAAQIAEFVSWKGMRVKVWRKFGNTLFPGGAEYHQSKDYMMRMIKKEIEPFIFHMSWTQNKDNKKLYFEQMAEWYTKDKKSRCQGLDCCVAEPIITCHFRDKPSFIPCKDSPPIDKGKKSWW